MRSSLVQSLSSCLVSRLAHPLALRESLSLSHLCRHREVEGHAALGLGGVVVCEAGARRVQGSRPHRAGQWQPPRQLRKTPPQHGQKVTGLWHRDSIPSYLLES